MILSSDDKFILSQNIDKIILKTKHILLPICIFVYNFKLQNSTKNYLCKNLQKRLYMISGKCEANLYLNLEFSCSKTYQEKYELKNYTNLKLCTKNRQIKKRRNHKQFLKHVFYHLTLIIAFFIKFCFLHSISMKNNAL